MMIWLSLIEARLEIIIIIIIIIIIWGIGFLYLNEKTGYVVGSDFLSLVFVSKKQAVQ